MKVVHLRSWYIVSYDSANKINDPFNKVLLPFGFICKFRVQMNTTKNNYTRNDCHHCYSSIKPNRTDVKHKRFFIQSFSPLFLSSPENIWCYNAFPLITIGIIPPRQENFKVFSRKLDKKFFCQNSKKLIETLS